MHQPRIFLMAKTERGRQQGKGSLWERVQPDNLFKSTPLLKLSEDGRKGEL